MATKKKAKKKVATPRKPATGAVQVDGTAKITAAGLVIRWGSREPQRGPRRG